MSKNKINLTILSLLVLSIFLFQIMFISASNIYTSSGVTFQSPTASSTVSATKVLNVTNATFNQMNNCTFYAKSSLTANSSWTLIKSSTANNTIYNVNATFNSAILEDSNNYIFNATCRNSTNDITDNTISSVIIDNTIPSNPTDLSPSTSTLITSSTTPTFSGTVINANTTSCTYVIARGDTNQGSDYITGTGTYSENSCTFSKSFSDTTYNGNWYWYLTSSDETNTSSSAKNIYQVSIPVSGGNLDVANQLQNQVNEQTEGQQNVIPWIIGIIIAIVILWIILKR